MRIRPCIDIHNGKVKQIVGGSLRDDAGARENFVSSRCAADYAAIYRDMNLPGGHIILLNSAKDPEAYEADRRQALDALRVWPGGLQIGGGITPETAPAFLDAGASHVIVTSYVFRDGRLDEERLRRMAASVGREHLVLDLSCRCLPDSSAASLSADIEDIGLVSSSGAADNSLSGDVSADVSGGPARPAAAGEPRYAVVTDRWQKMTEFVIDRQTLSGLSACCDEFLIHAADVEGRRAGIEKDLVRLLGDWLSSDSSSIPVTYAGGIHTLEDLDLIRRLSEDQLDVTVGSALDLFGGNLSLSSLTAAAKTPL